jgi:hypothetical protein
MAVGLPELPLVEEGQIGPEEHARDGQKDACHYQKGECQGAVSTSWLGSCSQLPQSGSCPSSLSRLGIISNSDSLSVPDTHFQRKEGEAGVSVTPAAIEERIGIAQPSESFLGLGSWGLATSVVYPNRVNVRPPSMGR